MIQDKKYSFYKNIDKANLELEISDIEKNILILSQNLKNAKKAMNKILENEIKDFNSDTGLILEDLKDKVKGISSYELDNGWHIDDNISNLVFNSQSIRTLNKKFGKNDVNKLRNAVDDLESIGLYCDDNFNKYWYSSDDYKATLQRWRDSASKILRIIEELQEK